MKKVFKKAIITIIMASFISVQISGTQAFARGNGHNHDHGHEHIHEENEYEDLENTTTDVTIDETENVEDITNNDVVAEENGSEDELLEEESTEGEVPTEDNEESTGEDNETPEFELPEVDIDESEEEPDVEGSEEIEEEIIDDENDTDTSEDEEVENENVSDSDIITLHPSVEEQLANLSQEQIDSYMEFAAKREPFYLQYPDDDKYLWILRDDGTLSYQYNPAEVYGEYNQANDILYAQNVTDEYSWMYKQFYVKDDYEIHRMNNDGTNDEIIYTSSTKINEIKGCEEYLFYLSQGAVYRLHIATGVEEYVCDIGNGCNIAPYDNYTVTWSVVSNEWIVDEEDGGHLYHPYCSYSYDMENKAQGDFPEDYDRVYSKLYEEKQDNNLRVATFSLTAEESKSENQIYIDERLGEYVPSIDKSKKYYTKNGGPCGDHYTVNNCVPKENATCNCLYYDTGIQCVAYACYVYDKWHGHKKTDAEKTTYSRIVDDSFWKTLLPGTYVRIFWDKAAEEKGHSLFIVDNTGDGLLVYEGNVSKNCDIYQHKYTYTELTKRHSYVGYIFYGHICEYSGEYSSNAKKHWYACNEASCTNKENEAAHIESEWYYDANFHYTKCKDCGYVMKKMEHTQGTTYEINGTTHSLSCTVCGMTMSEAAHNSSTTKNNNDGTHTLKCSVCGKSMSTASHTYGNYISDGSNHWKECTACKAITGKAAHTPGSLTNIGSIHRKTCTTCGYVTLSANHSYTSSYSKYSSSQHKATCACGAHQYVTHTMALSGVSASGHTQICSKCGYSVTGSHTFTISKNDTNTHKKTCSFCGYSTTVNHTYVSNGYNQYVHMYKCSVCGQTKGVSHSFTSTVTKVSTASTCTKTVKKCSCGYSTTVTDTSHRFTGIRCLDCNYWRG